jgi:hypothetical protein
MDLDDLVALRAQLHEAFRFLVETRHITVHDGLPDNASRLRDLGR